MITIDRTTAERILAILMKLDDATDTPEYLTLVGTRTGITTSMNTMIKALTGSGE